MAAPIAEWNVTGLGAFRNAVGWTQQAMAELVGLSRPTFSKIEAGEKAKHSTIHAVFEHLQEKFGSDFETLDLVPSAENTYELVFERKRGARIAHNGGPSWGEVLDGLTRVIFDVYASSDTGDRDAFHDEFTRIVVGYENMTGRKINARSLSVEP